LAPVCWAEALQARDGLFEVSKAGPRDMQGSDEGQRSGKTTKMANREARLAAKLRQNLTRRKEKARAAAKSADRVAPPSKDNDQGD
jgi:hypothetical protein